MIVVNPRKSQGTPYIRQTLVPAETVACLVWDGFGVEAICALFPQLEESDVLDACWYIARFGSQQWKGRWGLWARNYETRGICTLPPDSIIHLPTLRDRFHSFRAVGQNVASGLKSPPASVTVVTIFRRKARKVQYGDFDYWPQIVRKGISQLWGGDPL